MRHVCDTCGTLSTFDDTIIGAGDKHDGCPFDGAWQPFPDLPMRLAVDLACQQLTYAPEEEAFTSVVEIWQYLDWCVWGADELIARLRSICDYRLATGRWVGATEVPS